MGGNERKYSRLPILYDLGGLHQDPWSGTIKDGDTSDERNIDHSTSGEWKTRRGMSYIGQISSSTPNGTLHYHCDHAVASAIATVMDAATEFATGEGYYLATHLAVSATYYAPGRGSVNALYPSSNATAAHFAFEPATATASNIVATSGQIEFFWRTRAGALKSPKFADFPPDAETFLFDFGGNLGMSINTGGDVYAYLGSSVAAIEDTTTDYRHNTWYKSVLSWDFQGAATEGNFHLYTDDVEVDASTAAVAIPTLATGYFLNSLALNRAPVTANWGELSNEMFLIDEISLWDAPYYPQKITGIFDNSSQNRLIITAGKAVYRTTSFTPIVSSGSTTALTNGVRTSACEWQNNFYITDGTTAVQKITGSGTARDDLAGSPPAGRYIASYHNHLWIAGISASPESVRCSEFDTDSTWTVIVGGSQFDCTDTVKGIAPYAGQLVVGTKTTIEAISGYRRADFVKTLVSTDASCASHWSMKEVTLPGQQQALVWAGYDGLYMMIGGSVQKISRRIQTYWDSLNAADLEESCAVVNKPRGEYWLAVSTSGTDHDEIICWNYEKDTFSVYTYDQKIDVLGSFLSSGQYLLYGGNPEGYIYRMDNGTYDDHKEIGGVDGCYMYTKWFDVGFPEIEKDFRSLWVIYESTGQYDLELGWENNWNESTATDTIGNESIIAMAGQGGATAAKWDTAVWDTDVWSDSQTGSTRISQVHLYGENSRANSIRYRIKNKPGQVGANFKVRGLIKMWSHIEEYPA